jgi:DNA-3-methyladenine glycosylase II
MDETRRSSGQEVGWWTATPRDEDERVSAYVYLSLREPVLARLTARHGRPDPFAWPAIEDRTRLTSNLAAMALHIVSQQISTAAALTIYGRILAQAGVRTLTVEALSGLDAEQLRSAGLSHSKALALVELAQAQSRGHIDLEHMDGLPDEQVYARLVALRGIGPWSAQVFMINQLRRRDVLPAADLGLRLAVQREWRLPARPRAEEVEALARPWSPYRTYAAALLWASLRAS